MSAQRSIQASGLLAAPTSRRRAEAAGPLLPAAGARLLGFAGLAAFGALQWGRLVAPGAGGAMLGALIAALAAGYLLTRVAGARVTTRRRRAATALATVALALVAFAAAGLPAHLLAPRGWDDLAAGIGEGLGAVPSITVPYGGSDEWTRAVLVLGGAGLIGLAALLAFAPRRDARFGHPLAAAVALGTLYAAPVIQRHADHPFASGLAFALLLALFLWLERVERRNALPAATIVAAAALAGLVAAPQLDAGRALLDYEGLAQSLSGAKTTTYSWNHTYGPLNWPRDGREVLRVRSPQRAYWKAVNLTQFDGLRWMQAARRPGEVVDVARRSWITRIDVTVHALRSEDFIAAGTTLAIGGDNRAHGIDGDVLERSGHIITRGERYRAIVYLPRPTARQLGGAGTNYPIALHADYGFLRVPLTQRGLPADTQVVPIPFWGEVSGAQQPGLAATFAGTPYAGVYALAQRLRAQSATPYAYMRAVERYLTDGFAYSERPPVSRVPLAAFLLRDKVGYCQQFSGAMALLLRMAGIPARVAAGFAPGAFDDKTHEYTVRDIDAHSWVEVYFPGIGWVTRDPTPSASPARSQTADLLRAGAGGDIAIAGATGERALGGNTDTGLSATPATPTGADGASDTPWLVAAGLALVLAVAALVRRRRRRAAAAAATAAPDELAELRRALRRSGREPRPDLTLAQLAGRLDGSDAEGYVRALASARYGYEPARPTREQRAALRRELAAGLGLRGRLRSWWALPPQPQRRG